jgi:hypothetical protein
MAWGGIAAAQAASLDPQVLPGVQTATFEVVAAKPVDDPLTYEKPLPLELLPYQERTDKYFSIGTAFAIGDGRYVTAGHVLLSGVGSLWGPPALRDASGHVYAIDKVEKFSLGKDFAVFTLAGQPDVAPLPIDTTPALNQVVYAVGNALGTGVVIRDGLYTSDTPEQQDGRWKWMRFSAAASPGNSGGPLLDRDGKVIGVVLMKSANENLNYALPIHEVLDAPDHLAVFDSRLPYQFDVFDTTLSNSFKGQFALPLGFADFSKRFQELFDAYCDGQLKALLARDPDTLFPRGAGSHRLLYDVPSMGNFPTLIMRDANGEWGQKGQSSGTTTLADNGYIEAGAIGSNILFHLRKPDSISARQLYDEPERLMDLLAKVGFMKRQVGPENILITSLGKPTQDTVFADRWQRRWQVRTWPMAHRNALVMTFSLPVPDGYVTFMRIEPANKMHDCLINMQALTDFFFVTYDGTLAQWKDFLKVAPLPAAFDDIAIDIDYGKRLGYTSKRVRFSFTPELQKIGPDSMMTLGFGYFVDHGKVVWDVADVWAAANAHDHDWVNIARMAAPVAGLGNEFTNTWDKLVHRTHPYDAVARSDDDVMKITTVIDGAKQAEPPALYAAYYYTDGLHPQDEMKSKLDLLLKGVDIKEY